MNGAISGESAHRNPESWILYAPTLGSPGGFTAVTTQLELADIRPSAAIVSNAAVEALAPMGCIRHIETVTGHVAGLRALRRFLRISGPHRVFCAQNPVLPGAKADITLVQNYLAVNPVAALKADHSIRMCAYIFVTTALTWLQVLASSKLLVLNTNYPRLWSRMTEVEVVPNQLRPGFIRQERSVTRAPTLLLVTSWERFRGAHIVIAAFELSRLASQGWRLQIVARRSDARYQAQCVRLAALTEGVSVQMESTTSDVHRALADSSFALFPSVVEGASIAFLEAMHLGCVPIALSRPHYAEAYELATYDTEIRWVSEWTPVAWAKALSAAAHSKGE